MDIKKTKLASACIPILLSVTAANAVPVPGGTLDPLSIPKYVTPLVIPPPLFDDDGGSKPLDVQVALRQFEQQILPDGFPATTLWGYGDPDRPQTFNNPALTIEVTQDTLTTVTWSNQLVMDPEECFDDDDDGHHGDSDDDDHGHHGDDDDDHGHSGKGDDKRYSRGRSDDDDDRGSRWSYRGRKGDDDRGHHGNGQNRKPECNFLPHIITDAAGNPIVDQTLHWAAPNQDCKDGIPRTDCAGNSDQPYTGPIPMVTHLHGAHVGPISDGYPEAWWLPDANDIPNDYATEGTFYDDINGGSPGTGSAVYQYTNNQPTTTLWYHDHTLGMTRLNVYAAGAGFWLIRDANDRESGLLDATQSFPGPAPSAGSNPNAPGAERDRIREIPIAIQPKSFNADGSQYYPADRQFFEALGDGQTFALNDNMTSLVTADGTFPFMPDATSDIAPVWNPEAFFNTMVVNGRTWPQLDVASERYRFRLLNAADSRFLNLALFVVNPDGTLGQEIPFYQIGSDQGLLPNVVRIETGFATTLPGDGTDVGTGVTASTWC